MEIKIVVLALLFQMITSEEEFNFPSEFFLRECFQSHPLFDPSLETINQKIVSRFADKKLESYELSLTLARVLADAKITMHIIYKRFQTILFQCSSRSLSPLLCIGVPTAYRRGFDLVDRMKSLLRESQTLKSKIVYIIWQSESSINDTEKRTTLEKMGFIVKSNASIYSQFQRPDFPLSYGDPRENVIWRAKESLDYGELLKGCIEQNTPFILILEDDSAYAENFVERMFDTLKTIDDSEFAWVTLFTSNPPTNDVQFKRLIPKNPDGSFCWFEQNSISLLYRRSFAMELVDEIQKRYVKDPIDWIILRFSCQIKKQKMYEIIPNLVQHIGTQSTLEMNNYKIGRFRQSQTFLYSTPPA